MRKKIDHEECLKLRAQGMKATEIAKIYDCNPSTVWSHIKQENVKSISEACHLKRLTDEERKRVCDMYEHGIAVDRIAGKIGCGKETIKEICRNVKFGCKKEMSKQKSLTGSYHRGDFVVIMHNAFPTKVRIVQASKAENRITIHDGNSYTFGEFDVLREAAERYPV